MCGVDLLTRSSGIVGNEIDWQSVRSGLINYIGVSAAKN